MASIQIPNRNRSTMISATIRKRHAIKVMQRKMCSVAIVLLVKIVCFWCHSSSSNWWNLWEIVPERMAVDLEIPTKSTRWVDVHRWWITMATIHVVEDFVRNHRVAVESVTTLSSQIILSHAPPPRQIARQIVHHPIPTTASMTRVYSKTRVSSQNTWLVWNVNNWQREMARRCRLEGIELQHNLLQLKIYRLIRETPQNKQTNSTLKQHWLNYQCCKTQDKTCCRLAVLLHRVNTINTIFVQTCQPHHPHSLSPKDCYQF